jgi:hypothetical protein
MRAEQENHVASVPVSQRPNYVLTLRAEPNVDAIRSLRFALKILFRRLGLKCIAIREDKPGASP